MPEEKERQLTEAVRQVLAAEDVSEKNGRFYRDLSLLVLQTEEPGAFETVSTYQVEDLERICPMYIMTQEDYNHLTGNQVTVSEGECMVITQISPYQEKTLTLLGNTYQVVPAKDNGLWDEADIMGPEVYYVLVANLNEMRVLAAKQKEAVLEPTSSIKLHYEFDLDTDDETQKKIYRKIMEKMAGISLNVMIESAAVKRSSYYSLYAGLLFLGIFLGTLFVMATVLIIYYKQVTEGYEDKGRFEIMQKVGLSKAEIRASIRSQILLMFFLPLAAAALHITMAFPLITRLLAAMNLTNVRLFAVTTAGTLGAFAAVYTAVYLLTSKVYLKIVS